MILYLTRPSQLRSVASNQTVCFPASLLQERNPFLGFTEMRKRIRQARNLEATTVILRKG